MYKIRKSEEKANEIARMKGKQPSPVGNTAGTANAGMQETQNNGPLLIGHPSANEITSEAQKSSLEADAAVQQKPQETLADKIFWKPWYAIRSGAVEMFTGCGRCGKKPATKDPANSQHHEGETQPSGEAHDSIEAQTLAGVTQDNQSEESEIDDDNEVNKEVELYYKVFEKDPTKNELQYFKLFKNGLEAWLNLYFVFQSFDAYIKKYGIPINGIINEKRSFGINLNGEKWNLELDNFHFYVLKLSDLNINYVHLFNCDHGNKQRQQRDTGYHGKFHFIIKSIIISSQYKSYKQVKRKWTLNHHGTSKIVLHDTSISVELLLTEVDKNYVRKTWFGKENYFQKPNLRLSDLTIGGVDFRFESPQEGDHFLTQLFNTFLPKILHKEDDLTVSLSNHLEKLITPEIKTMSSIYDLLNALRASFKVFANKNIQDKFYAGEELKKVENKFLYTFTEDDSATEYMLEMFQDLDPYLSFDDKTRKNAIDHIAEKNSLGRWSPYRNWLPEMAATMALSPPNIRRKLINEEAIF